MNNNRLNQYNPNVTDKNNNENMQVVSKIEPMIMICNYLPVRWIQEINRYSFQSIPAGDVRKYTKKDVEPVFKLTLQQPSESERKDVEQYNDAIAATSNYYQNIDSHEQTSNFLHKELQEPR